ncbi:hypothetical protein DFH09DRAFT_1319335 [Mycena vulgaris]|nr:hypothetical protein DFH09DRAFT_1319335 [Mycena vulgaris]
MSTSLLLSLGLLRSFRPRFFTSNIMSILINGHSVSSVSYSHSTARTTLSINLASSLGPARNSVFLLTSCTACFGNFSASIVCDVSPHTPPALVLGTDRASLLRDSLLSLLGTPSMRGASWLTLLTLSPVSSACIYLFVAVLILTQAEPLSGPPLRWSPVICSRFLFTLFTPILHVKVPDCIVPPFNLDTVPLHGDSSSGESPHIFCIPYSRLPLTRNLAFTLNL